MNRIEQTSGTMAWILLLLAFLCGLNQNKVSGTDITLVPPYNPLFVKEGTKFTIECKVKNLPKNQDVVVQHGDFGDLQELNYDLKKKVDIEKAMVSVIVTKDKIEETDVGNYMCISGGKQKDFQLVISTVVTQNSNVTVGEDVTIKCDPNLDFAQMDIVWSKNGKALDTIPGVKDRVKYGDKNVTLTLQKTVEDDAGEYECNVTFFRGTYVEQSFSDMAKMLGKPYFRSDDSNKKLSLLGNQSIDLNCDVLGYPKPDVTWLKDDEVIQSDSRVLIKDKGSSSRLKIGKILLRDSGTYVCNVENTLGRKQRSFKISIEGVISSASYLRYGLSQVVLLACILFLTL